MANNFTKGNIVKSLIHFAIPILFALLLQTLYGACDLLIVGQFSGELSTVNVSAVSTGSQIMHTLTVVISGLAMGLCVYVAREIGANNAKKAGDIIGSAIFIFAILSIVLSIIMVLLTSAMVSLMNAPLEAFDATCNYVKICSIGAIFIVAYNLLGSIFRGLGDAKTPLLSVAIASVINIALDYILVKYFHMGASGAAIATVVAQMVSVVISLFIISKKQLPFEFNLSSIRFNMEHVFTIFKIGTPIALQDLLVNMSFLVILSIVNAIGLTASAGMGVAEKLCGFIMLVPSAFMQSMSAFVAQNIGAKEYGRAKKALKCGIALSLFVSIFIFYFSFFHGDILSAIFASDYDVIMASWDYLKAYAIDCLLTSVLFSFIGYFNGCSKTTFVMLQGIIGAFLVRIPVSYIMSKQAFASLFHIGLATPCSSFVQIVLCIIYYLYLSKNDII